MKEAGYQAKIIKGIEGIGGVVVNGNYTKAGIADLVCGYPVNSRLLHLHVEVKTEKDYYRVFSSITEKGGVYDFHDNTKSLKKHEFLQITKLNMLRRMGGLGLIAWSFEQVKEYVDGQTQKEQV